ELEGCVDRDGDQAQITTPRRLAYGVAHRRLGLADVPVCGTNVEVLRALGLDAPSLAGRIGAVLG
ncbi:MAG: hypothetical protein MUF66_15180, partial [Gammaproteobacteria bacterium]|nr:hypothetical protein [Gammaproteobacteria bacterium]